jgi:hypothetical protein
MSEERQGGGLEIVGEDEGNDAGERRRPAKRSERSEPSGDVDDSMPHDEESPASKRWAVPEEPEDQGSQIERLIKAKRRRRRFGRQLANAQMAEELEEIKTFMAMDDKERSGYLAVMEYDDSEDRIVRGLTKVSSLGLKFALARVVSTEDYGLMQRAVDHPDIQDSFTDVLETIEIGEYADMKALKTVAAVGHIADALVSAGLKIYGAVNTEALKRAKEEAQSKPQSTQVQTRIVVTSIDGSTDNGSSETAGQMASAAVETI